MRELVVAMALLLPACSFLSPQADPTRFAVLASVDELPGEEAAVAPPARSPVRWGLGPLTLPEYVRRSELVSRAEGTRIVISGTERWAEPFDRAVERVLAIDLERATGATRVIHHPWYASDRPDAQVEIAFSRCEREESGKIVVAARWSVRDLRGGGSPVERESRIERETAGPEGASTARALSLALVELAREIATAWAALEESR
jgi:uncharacterized protein